MSYGFNELYALMQADLADSTTPEGGLERITELGFDPEGLRDFAKKSAIEDAVQFKAYPVDELRRAMAYAQFTGIILGSMATRQMLNMAVYGRKN